MIIGTAGHVDHGKTALVKALTGVDTDRLPEEKRRGITIDLGFASLALEGGVVAGVVDVPGHESFVRTMVAGAAGVDVALLVVAADEGIMPQTREHIAILELLGVRRAVVALTKADLVDVARCDGVARDIAIALTDTALQGAQCIAVSVASGQGVSDVRAALAQATRDAANRDDGDLVRLPVDRVFTKPGSGTVVTGTLWSGQLHVGDDVTLMPAMRRGRVRGLQIHGAIVDEAGPGTRVAVALGGVDRDHAARGDVLVGGGAWVSSTVLRADVALVADAEPLTVRTRVRLHLGTAEVGARVVCAGGPLVAGGTRPARLSLDVPLVARGGDRFVLRRPLPAGTIGGGVVTDAVPGHRRVKPFDAPRLSVAERVQRVVHQAGLAGVAEAVLPVRMGGTPAAIHSLVSSREDVVSVRGVVIDQRAIDLAAKTLVGWLDAYHRANPRSAGAPLEAARASCHATASIAGYIIERLVLSGDAVVAGSAIRRASWRAEANDAASALRTATLARLDAAGAAAPSVNELERELRTPVIGVLRQLERDGLAVALATDRFASAAAARDLWRKVANEVSPHVAYRPSELRAVFGVSRQYLMPWLEYFDRVGHSRRDGDARWFKTGATWQASP